MVESHVFRQKSDAATGRRVSKFVAQHFSQTAAGKHESDSEVHGRGFTGTVRPEKTEDLAALHAQREIAQRGDPLAAKKAAVLLADVVERKSRNAGHG